jgi:hypothetical protein
MPHRDRLGTSEGARILGQALAAEGDVDSSYALLSAYLDGRVEAFRAAEQAFDQAISEARDRLVGRLLQGGELNFDYRRFELAGEDERGRMVAEYLGPELRDDRARNCRNMQPSSVRHWTLEWSHCGGREAWKTPPLDRPS